jgi:hypothetical protein
MQYPSLSNSSTPKPSSRCVLRHSVPRSLRIVSTAATLLKVSSGDMPQRELTVIHIQHFPHLTCFRYAPFVYDAWRSPEVLAIVSKIAGVELVPQMDFEIAHMNVSVQTEEEKQAALAALTEKASRDADEGVSGCPWEDDRPIVDWHTDSYPFVCVLMLSDCTNMIGGETALRCGNGEIMRVRGPGMVRFLLRYLKVS